MAEAPRVLVIGATSAIAQAVARVYARRGARLVIVGRDATKLEAVRADLVARGAAQAHAIVADLADVEHHAAIVDEAAAALAGIDVALVAHGVLPDQARCAVSFADARRALDLNFTSAASVAHELANRFEKSRHGTLAVIGSVAGDRGRQSNFVYGAAKAGLGTLVQGIAHQLSGSGARAVLIKPGFIDTPMTAHLPKRGPLWSKPETIAAAIHRAALSGGPVRYAPAYWRLILLLIRMTPAAIFHRTKL